MIKKNKQNVVFDFDGVIHSYKSGWKGTTVIPDPPVEGIKEAIDEIRKYYNVIILSTRCSSLEGKMAICEWLNKYQIEVDSVVDKKPPAVVYIDDRAICFDGNSKGLFDRIRDFKTWIESK